MSPGRRIKWGPEDIANAITLRAVSPKTYTLLRKLGFPLPELSVLRRRAAKIELSPGIIKEVLEVMKGKNLGLMEKICVLCFDEIHISHFIEIDKKTEQVYGPAKKCQLGIVRG